MLLLARRVTLFRQIKGGRWAANRDVSKDTLDSYRLSDGQHIQVSNDKSGRGALIRWFDKDDNLLIVFEATGAYHRAIETVLGARAIPFVKVNPRQARRFAEATGRFRVTGMMFLIAT